MKARDDYIFNVSFMDSTKFANHIAGKAGFASKIGTTNVIKVTVPVGSDYHQALFVRLLAALSEDQEVAPECKKPLYEDEEKRGPITKARNYYFKATIPVAANMHSQGVATTDQFEVMMAEIERRRQQSIEL